MRRTRTLESSLDLALQVSSPRLSSSGQLLACRSCLVARQRGRAHTPAAASFTTHSAQRKNEDSFTERLRSRIWGGNAPGQKDPYSEEEREVLRKQQTKRSKQLDVEGDRDASQFDIEVDEADVPRVTSELRKRGARYSVKGSESGEGGITQPKPNAGRREPVYERYRAADKKDDNEDTLADYEPAKTIEELVEFGGERVRGWNETWEGRFGPAQPLTSPSILTLAVHRSCIEVYTLLGAGLSPHTLCASKRPWLETFQLTKQVTLDAAGAPLDPNSTALPELMYPPGVREGILKLLRTMSRPKERSVEEMMMEEGGEHDVAGGMVKELGKRWLHLPLTPAAKFFILKRIHHLTGRAPVPDKRLDAIRTAGAVVNEVRVPPKPSTTYQALRAHDTLANLPNVHLAWRRRTPVDAEVALGRWKLVEAELKRLDLPVLGGH